MVIRIPSTTTVPPPTRITISPDVNDSSFGAVRWHGFATDGLACDKTIASVNTFHV
jgi:hypothetical protein